MRFALRGFDDATLSLFLAVLLGFAGATALAGGLGCAMRGLRNPAPPPLPDNVIPLYRARAALPSEMRSGSGRRS
jgi:hypothetical protein